MVVVNGCWKVFVTIILQMCQLCLVNSAAFELTLLFCELLGCIASHKMQRIVTIVARSVCLSGGHNHEPYYKAEPI